MRREITILSFWALFLYPAYSQPVIFKAGDGWDLKVDSALSLIKEIDPEKHSLIMDVCDQVDFWISDFSSSWTDSKGLSTIYIADKDVKINSINNLAGVLVHESLHLYLNREGIHGTISREEEESLCYRYEMEFLRKIPSVESWLLENASKKISINEKAIIGPSSIPN